MAAANVVFKWSNGKYFEWARMDPVSLQLKHLTKLDKNVALLMFLSDASLW